MIKFAALKPVASMLAREICMALLLLLGVSVVVFAVLYLAPGNPFDTLLSRPAGQSGWLASIFDWPYLKWFVQVLQGDLGHSVRTGLPVLGEVTRTAANTLYLTLGALTVSLAIAMPLAILSARKGITTTIWGLTAVSYILSSLPAFWFGYLVIYIAMHQFGIFPMAFGSAAQSSWVNFLLPVLVLGLCSGGLSEMVRYLREELIRVLTQDYIRTARAKGAAVWRHAFKEGVLIPITETIAAKIPFILGGAVVEQIFNWPGMGRLAWQAAQDRDYPLIMGITLMAALLVRMGSLIKQMVHIMVNPRMSQN
jgi:peptide/nickel transport system permease protein